MIKTPTFAVRLFLYVHLVNVAVIFIAAALIFLPAPFYFLWLVAVVASELQPFLLLSAVILLIVSLALRKNLRDKRARWQSTVAIALSALSVLIVWANLFEIFTFSNALRIISTRDYCRFRLASKQAGRSVTREYAKPDGKPLLLDVFEPATGVATTTASAAAVTAGDAPKHPAIIVIHGGSWSGGRRSDFPAWDEWLTTLGYTVFDIDYRLADGKVRFPVPVEDVESAIAWVQSHAEEYKIDPARVALLGRSAGGQMALAAAYRSTGRAKAAGAYPPVRCVVSFYGPTDLAWDYVNPVQPDVIDACGVLRNYLGGEPEQIPEVYREASPRFLVDHSTPPTLLIHGGRDQLVSRLNSNRLILALQGHNIQRRYCFIPWANHGFDWHFNGFSSQLAKPILQEFLSESFRDRKIDVPKNSHAR